MSDQEKLEVYEKALKKIIAIAMHPEKECPEMIKYPQAIINYMLQQARDAIEGKPDFNYPG